MASLGVAALRTSLDLGGLRTGLNQAKSETERTVKDMDARLKTLGRGLTSAGKAMTLGLTAPIGAMGVAVLKIGGDFQKSMNRVSALSGATGRDLERLTGLARELGATTVFSASQAAEGMSFLAMAGLEVNQIYDAMPATLELAAAAQLGLADSADIVTNILTGFGMPVDQLGNSVDVLTTAFISANTDLRQLGDAMAYAGPVASGLGRSPRTWG